MSYKGYRVTEEIIKDYEKPLTDIVLCAPCGCQACEEQVQPGHFACSPSPEELVNDVNVSPTFESNQWYWSYHGPSENVDEWLEVD